MGSRRTLVDLADPAWLDPELVRALRSVRSRGVLRFDREFDLTVDGNTFVVVVAEGSYGLPNTSRDHIVPFAFTNAIYLEP